MKEDPEFDSILRPNACPMDLSKSISDKDNFLHPKGSEDLTVRE